jgi:hypothetical protein
VEHLLDLVAVVVAVGQLQLQALQPAHLALVELAHQATF